MLTPTPSCRPSASSPRERIAEGARRRLTWAAAWLVVVAGTGVAHADSTAAKPESSATSKPTDAHAVASAPATPSSTSATSAPPASGASSAATSAAATKPGATPAAGGSATARLKIRPPATPKSAPAPAPPVRTASSTPPMVTIPSSPPATPMHATSRPQPSSLAPQEEQIVYHYNALGRRDPFLPLIGGGFIGADEGGKAAPDVGGLKVVGIVWGANDKFALIEDPRGNSQVLRQGDKVMNGVVEELKRNSVVVKLSVDGQTQTVEIPLTVKGEKDEH